MATAPANKFFPTVDDAPFMGPSSNFALLVAWQRSGKLNAMSTFELSVRDMPPNRNFMVMCGLEEMITTILSWRYDSKRLTQLKKNSFIDGRIEKYLQHFRFTGSIDALPEGTIFFPGEPILRVTAPLGQASLLYNYLVNASSSIMFASKFVRASLAAPGKKLITGTIRGHSLESMFKCSRAAYITGFNTILAIGPTAKQGLPLWETLKGMHHLFVNSFSNESEAFAAMAEAFPHKEATLIVDTYNVRRGVDHAIQQHKKLRTRGGSIDSILIDSGDIMKNVLWARRQLDAAGCQDVKIGIAGNLNEYKIASLLKARIPFDSCMLVTEYMTSADAPKLEAVYKMVAIEDHGTMRPTMKLSQNKVSLPGAKQVYRVYRGSRPFQDTIGLINEKCTGQPLLRRVIATGKLVRPLPDVRAIRRFVAKQLSALPPYLKSLTASKPYPVKISAGVRATIKRAKKYIYEHETNP